MTAALALVALRFSLRPAPRGGRVRREEDDDGSSPTATNRGALVVVVLAAGLFVLASILSAGLGVYGFIGESWWGETARRDQVLQVAGASAERGRRAIVAYECRSCHAVPGMPDLARYNVGPPLDGVSGRAYIGGVLPNRPENLVAWIQNPPGFSENTAMPDMGIDAETAGDIAAYLYQY